MESSKEELPKKQDVIHIRLSLPVVQISARSNCKAPAACPMATLGIATLNAVFQRRVEEGGLDQRSKIASRRDGSNETRQSRLARIYHSRSQVGVSEDEFMV